MAQLRGTELGLVPQDPMSNLDPIMRIGQQIDEGLMTTACAAGGTHAPARSSCSTRSACRTPGAARSQYPHEFSGGMRQRALIAMGLSCRPALLIADEPTSALDVTVQRGILDQLAELTEELGTAVLLITHDLGLAAERADRRRRHVPRRHRRAGSRARGPRRPQHEYTKRLMAAAPSLASRRIEIARERRADDAVPDDPSLARGADDARSPPARRRRARRTSTSSRCPGVSKVFQLAARACSPAQGLHRRRRRERSSSRAAPRSPSWGSRARASRRVARMMLDL